MRYALLSCTILMLGGAAYAQDRTSSEYCDPVCLEHRDDSRDCSFHNYAQCQATRIGTGGDCVPNPFLAQCTRPSVSPRARHRKHH
jgi:hypothetical protein